MDWERCIAVDLSEIVGPNGWAEIKGIEIVMKDS